MGAAPVGEQHYELKEVKMIQTVEIEDFDQALIMQKDIETITYEKLYKIPKLDTSFKAYMDYRCISDKTSKQWELRQQAKTNKDGLRMIDDYYCVAMGKFYSEQCGKKFEITLDTDTKFKIIVSDLKNPKHCDKTNSYTPLVHKGKKVYNDNDVQMVNVTEFLVDEKKLPEQVKTTGSISCLGFEGNIKEIKEIAY